VSFEIRDLTFIITLGAGAYGEQVGDTVTLSGLRSSVSLEQWGGETMGMCNAHIFGVPLDLMNRMTAIGPIMTQVAGKNGLEIKYGDSSIFKGTIWQSWPEFQAAPEVSIVINASSGLVNALKPEAAISYKGGKDAADMLSQLATIAGYDFENNGVSVQLIDQVLTGSTLDKIKAVCRAAAIRYTIDNDTLAIWPDTGYRSGEVLALSPQSGMIGYPIFNESYMGLRHEFLPTAKVGGRFSLSGSIVTTANTDRPWTIAAVTHNLETITPGGVWFTELHGYNFG